MSRPRLTGATKPRGPWRRRAPGAGHDPAAVFAELGKRELKDLAACKLAWEAGADPVAIMAAVAQADLPDWLADALLVLTLDAQSGGAFQRRLWKRREADAVDAGRALNAASARANPELPQTWEWSYKIAQHFAKTVGENAAKRSYQRVCRGISNPGRYLRPPSTLPARLHDARLRFLGGVKAKLAK